MLVQSSFIMILCSIVVISQFINNNKLITTYYGNNQYDSNHEYIYLPKSMSYLINKNINKRNFLNNNKDIIKKDTSIYFNIVNNNILVDFYNKLTSSTNNDKYIYYDNDICYDNNKNTAYYKYSKPIHITINISATNRFYYSVLISSMVETDMLLIVLLLLSVLIIVSLLLRYYYRNYSFNNDNNNKNIDTSIVTVYNTNNDSNTTANNNKRSVKSKPNRIDNNYLNDDKENMDSSNNSMLTINNSFDTIEISLTPLVHTHNINNNSNKSSVESPEVTRGCATNDCYNNIIDVELSTIETDHDLLFTTQYTKYSPVQQRPFSDVSGQSPNNLSEEKLNTVSDNDSDDSSLLFLSDNNKYDSSCDEEVTYQRCNMYTVYTPGRNNNNNSNDSCYISYDNIYNNNAPSSPDVIPKAPSVAGSVTWSGPRTIDSTASSHVVSYSAIYSSCNTPDINNHSICYNDSSMIDKSIDLISSSDVYRFGLNPLEHIYSNAGNSTPISSELSINTSPVRSNHNNNRLQQLSHHMYSKNNS